MPPVKEPALVAAIGVGGVLVGAVGGGVVQATLARSDRRRDGRNAARLLYIQLHDAEKAVADLRELRDWNEMITDWREYGEKWERYSDALPAVLNTSEFTTVTSAFGCLASLGRSRDGDGQKPRPQPDGTANFGPEDALLGVYLKTVQRAKRIVLNASFRWWEIRAKREALAEQGPPKLPTP